MTSSVLWCQVYTFIDGCRVAFKQSCTCSIKFHKNNKKIKWQQTLHLTYNQILSPIHARKRCLEYRVYNTFYYVHVSLVTMLLIQVSESRLSALINLLPEVSSITNIHQFFSLFKIIILKIFVAWLMICIIIFFLLYYYNVCGLILLYMGISRISHQRWFSWLFEGYLVMMFWSGVVNRIIYAVLFFFTIDCVW